MAKKAFKEVFTDFGRKTAVDNLVDFINRNNLTSVDYRLIPVFKGVDSDGNTLGTKIYCVYHAEEKLN